MSYSLLNFFAIVTILSTPDLAICQVELPLNKAIHFALENNLELKQSQIQERMSSEDLFQSKVNRYPNLNFVMNGDVNFGRSLNPITNLYLSQNTISSTENLSSSFVIFQGFQKLNEIKKNKYLVEIDQTNIQKIRNDLTIQVITDYLALLSYRDQLKAAQEHFNLSKVQYDVEAQKYNVGKKVHADLSKAKYQMLKSDVDISNIQNEINKVRIDLIQLMNADPKNDFQVVEPADTPDVSADSSAQKVYDYAVTRLPEIRGAELKHLEAIQEIEIAKAGYFPTITFSNTVASGYLYQFNYQTSIFQGPQRNIFYQLKANRYAFTGITLNFAIFNNYAVRVAVQKAKLNLESASIKEQSEKSNLYKTVSQAISDMLTAKKNYITSRQSYAAAKETFDIMKKRYNIGVSSSFELGQAENELNIAQFTMIHDKYDLIFKTKVIDFYSGTPLDY